MKSSHAFTKYDEIVHQLTNPPYGHQFCGHVAHKHTSGDIDVNFTRRQADMLTAARTYAAYHNPLAVRPEVWRLITNTQPSNVDLYVAARFAPFESTTNTAPLAYYETILAPLSASALKTIIFLLGETPATCVPLAICKRILHGGSLAYGSLSFGPVNGRDDIEYGQNKWI